MKKMTKMPMAKSGKKKMKATSAFTPALNNIRGKSGEKMLEKAMKPRKKANYKIPATPKVSGIGWGM